MVDYLTERSDSMEIALIVVSIILIALVLLQSNKASDSSQIISGGNAELFQNQKERGMELFVTRLTILMGILFFVISFIMFIE